jgi:hypothetical protein
VYKPVVLQMSSKSVHCCFHGSETPGMGLRCAFLRDAHKQEKPFRRVDWNKFVISLPSSVVTFLRMCLYGLSMTTAYCAARGKIPKTQIVFVPACYIHEYHYTAKGGGTSSYTRRSRSPRQHIATRKVSFIYTNQGSIEQVG